MDDTKPGQTTRHLLCPRPYPALLSLVVPIYNEERVLPFLRSEIARFQEDVKCLTEVVLVNDGSSDGTLDHLVEWASSDPTVKVLHLSRNSATRSLQPRAWIMPPETPWFFSTPIFRTRSW